MEMTPYPVCPHCHRSAPLVYRGLIPTCTACGRRRNPLAARSVTLAGGPSKLGGAFAKALGWLVLLCGLSIALGVGLLGSLYSLGLALALGLPVAAVALGIGVFLVRGGTSLTESGHRAESLTKTDAIFALAASRGGMLSTMDVAQALAMRVEEADALLTDLAKKDAERVVLEVNDYGGLYYRFPPPPGTPIVRWPGELESNKVPVQPMSEEDQTASSGSKARKSH